MFYANNIIIPRENDSKDSSNGGSTMSDSSGEAEFPNYDTDSNGTPYSCTLTTRWRKGSSIVTLTVDPSETMQRALNKYCEITNPPHAPGQGITLMINSGT